MPTRENGAGDIDLGEKNYEKRQGDGRLCNDHGSAVAGDHANIAAVTHGSDTDAFWGAAATLSTPLLKTPAQMSSIAIRQRVI